MFKGICAGLVVAVTLFLAVTIARPLFFSAAATVIASSQKTEKMGRAVADGTFIQWWMVKDWDDGKWTAEFEVMKEAGMNYLILAPVAFYETDEKTGKGITKTIYPTALADGYEVMKDGRGEKYPDVIDACLRNAQKMDIKVFLGLNSSEEWWSNRRNAAWINSRMKEGNRIADELWKLYYEKYKGTFYGWYWCWEADNFYFKRLDPFNSAKILTNAIKIHLSHFDKKGMRLPFMLSPFMNRWLGTPRGFAKLWEYVFANSGMKEGDIFCPQDSVGTGALKVEDLEAWFSELRRAVNSKPGLKLWADVETFDKREWTSAPIDRFIKQMQAVNPYVDNIVTFAYSHYYSPNTVDPGFHKSYTDYIRTGSLENDPPAVPGSFKAAVKRNGEVYLSWKAAKDNTGVCGYYIYRNGSLIANKQVKKVQKGSKESGISLSITDKGLEPGAEYMYEIQAYDFAGNVSPKSQAAAVIRK